MALLGVKGLISSFIWRIQVCPGLSANEIQIPYDKHHKVSSLVKRHQNTHNSVKYEVPGNMKMSDNPTKYEVLIEQYLHSILDISGRITPLKLQVQLQHQLRLDHV